MVQVPAAPTHVTACADRVNALVPKYVVSDRVGDASRSEHAAQQCLNRAPQIRLQRDRLGHSLHSQNR